MSNLRSTVIAVCGAGTDASPEMLESAYAVGRELAQRGVALVCGGKGGVMEAAAKGCIESGGVTIGLLPGGDPAEANAWIQFSLPTNLGLHRNGVLVSAGSGVIAIGGRYGTLTEVAAARNFGRRVALLHPQTGLVAASHDDEHLYIAESPADAVAWILGSEVAAVG